MPITYAPGDLNATLRDVGRAVIMQADTVWDGATNLAMTFLADTEGDITTEPNASFVYLEAPEVSGPGKLKGYYSGEDPVLTVPIADATADVAARVSPTGFVGAGHTRRVPVKERTIALFPEELFFNATTGEYDLDLEFTGTKWQLSGVDLDARQERLMGVSMWFWRGHWGRALPAFRHDDAGKTVQSHTFQVMLSELPLSVIPNGHRLYTRGDPADAGIDIHPVV